jgi:multiple sugar transport system substrate-binding protein
MKPVDAALNEAHWYMNAIGPGWFDKDWKPIFNGPKGVEAIETLKSVAQYAPAGFTSHANDESSINLQQGLAMMGLQWITRAASMDDPAKSRVVGKISWAPPPGGGQRIANDGFVISRFSSQDKDTLFKMIATATNRENMRAISSRIVPPRKSLLNDPELQKKYRYYPAAVKSLEMGKPYPPLPEFMEVGDIVTRRVNQAVTGEISVKEALDKAAEETEVLLRKRGYYK